MANMKKLRVCLSRDIPALPDRSFNYLYLAYDKLDLYAGQNKLEENYAISSELPTEPVPGMIYILDTDGSVYRNMDYSNVKIAEIEDVSQIDLLRRAGTVFRINSNRRYIDSQTRTLTLPFDNGTYELNVSVRNNQIFDNETIMKYNKDHERFEVYGPLNEEFIDFSKPFRGGTTDTVKIKTDGPRINAEVKISSIIGNLLRKRHDGLYIKPKDVITREEFEKWSNYVGDFKDKAQDVLDNIDSNIKYMQGLISEENINDEIMSILNGKFHDIEIALENYQHVVDSMDLIQTKITNYAMQEANTTREQLLKIIEDNKNWEELDNAHEEYVPEVDYYQKSEEYLYPEMTEEEVQIVLAAAVNFIIEELQEGGEI